MAEGRIRIQDVAAHAGVSSATVSLVLSERFGTRVSTGTAERVRAAAGELGYQVVEKNYELGWLTVVVDTKAPRRLLNDALGGVLQEASHADHAVAVVPVGADGDEVRGVAATLARVPRHRVACIARSEALDEWNLRLPESTVVVTLDDGRPGDQAHRCQRVVPGSEPAARALAGVLAERGHHEVAVVSDGLAVAAAIWTSSLEGAGLHVSGQVDVAPPGGGSAEAELRRLLVNGPGARRTTAMVCLNPRAVAVVRKVVEGSGLRVPQDVSVIVQDDGRADVDNVLPTSAFPAREMGRAAARVLLDGTLEGRARSRVVISVPRTVTGERRIRRAASSGEGS